MSKVILLFSSLLDSNKYRTDRIQTLINTGLFWCIGSFSKNSKKQNQKKKKKKTTTLDYS